MKIALIKAVRMNNQISIFRYMYLSQSMFRWAISIVLAIMISFVITGINLYHKINSNQKVINALSPYIMTLVEVNDRTEINRVLGAVVKNENAKLILVKDGSVYSSTGDVQELDSPYVPTKINFKLFEGLFSSNEIIVKNSIRRNSSSTESTIYYFGPLKPIINNTLAIMFIVFVVSILISFMISYRTRQSLKKALMPLEQLQEEIKNIKLNKSQVSTPIKIKELEEIRQTIIETRHDLDLANEKLATQKAKELSADAYKRLIHDLHNPVAALRQMVKIQTMPNIDEESKQEALESVPEIAEEILLQVTAAKKNLEYDSLALQNIDIRNCLKESFNQVRTTAKSNDNKLSLNLPDYPVFIKHDPTVLKRAIVNLLENGIEASKDKVKLELEQNDRYTSIKVADDGNGLSEDKVSLFLQGRGMSSKGNRQAFGLTSASHIARSHGGKIIYQRSDLGGASFEIRLEAR